MSSFRQCIWFALFALLYLTNVECKVTMEQMEKTSTMIRSVCQPRTKITSEMADGIRQGKFPNEKVLKCYAQCVMEMSGLMKKNKVTYDSAIKQIDLLLPEEIAEPNKNALVACKDASDGIKDPCEAAYVILQCFYKNNEKFMFP